MEDTPEIQEDLGNGGKFKNWLQDNIRIVISVLIVVAIAAGIYSYSKRAETPITSEEIALEEIEQQRGEDAVTIIGENEEAITEDEATDESVQESQETKPTEMEEKAEEVKISENAQSQASVSEETGEAFVQIAVAGDSMTTLARKAAKNYLEKNNDSSLTAEHKIYIEDYMRKHVGQSGSLNVGDQVSYSKTLIRDAIEKSKTLNENQLENLKKYSARVSTI